MCPIHMTTFSCNLKGFSEESVGEGGRAVVCSFESGSSWVIYGKNWKKKRKLIFLSHLSGVLFQS